MRCKTTCSDCHQPRSGLLAYEAPFAARGEAGAAQPAQAGRLQRGDHRFGVALALQALLQQRIAAGRAVLRQADVAFGLVLDRFDNAGKISRVGMPVLVLHGEGDPITPAALGRRLFAAAREPKELHVFPEAGHVDLFEHGADRVVIEFVERVMRD